MIASWACEMWPYLDLSGGKVSLCNLFNDSLNAGYMGYFQVDAYRQCCQ